MYLAAFYIDCAERPCRAEVFTGSASDAAFFIDERNHGIAVPAFLFAVPVSISIAIAFAVSFAFSCIFSGVADFAARNHGYRSCRTMTGAVAAGYAIGKRNAVFFDPYGMSYGDGRFFGRRYFQYCSGRAYFGAFHAFRTAVASFIRGFRLHQSH